jgi:hypothetical protein
MKEPEFVDGLRTKKIEYGTSESLRWGNGIRSSIASRNAVRDEYAKDRQLPKRVETIEMDNWMDSYRPGVSVSRLP